MRVATWNSNSVKQLLPRLLPWPAQRQPVAGRVRSACVVDREARKGGTPSDQAPVIVAVAATTSPTALLRGRRLEAIVFP